jgi:hypothetical protein
MLQDLQFVVIKDTNGGIFGGYAAGTALGPPQSGACEHGDRGSVWTWGG